MSDEGSTKVPPAAAEQVETKPDEASTAEAPAADAKVDAAESTAKPSAEDASQEEAAATKATEPAEPSKDKPDVENDDVTEKKTDGEAPEAAAAENEVEAGDKSKNRRKSAGIPEHKGKKLNKKGSKAKFFHLDAQPGDHFLVKLKGYPQWPVIICDEEMLPESLLKHRPVTARRADGTYREDYADGGKRAHDRTFPVMYLRTNEFGWVPNSALQELTAEKARELNTDKIRKAELKSAFELAEEQNSLDHYKKMLQSYQEELLKQQAEEAEATPAKKSKKGAAAASAAEDEAADEDVEMADAADEEPKPKKESKSKKRKAEEEVASTPQRSDSVKKPKIKLNTSSTPKTANGVAATPKSGKEGSAAKPKSKSKNKDGEDKKAEKAAAVPKEPELTAEERHQRKEKEVLFLRHKLQRGLLLRDQEPKEDEMKLMSDYITKLEGFPDLEVSIIRSTKINKVLKAILKLDAIPKEADFNFKGRSQTLLDKWTKILNGAEAGTTGGSSAANGANGTHKEAKSATNGVKDDAKQTKKGEKSAEAEPEASKAPVKGETTAGEEAAPASLPEPVEASA